MTVTDEIISMSGNCCTRIEHVQERNVGNKKEKQQGIILHYPNRWTEEKKKRAVQL